MKGGVKVSVLDPDHDNKVSFAIDRAMQIAAERSLRCGIGVLEFRDVTVVVLSEKVPDHEVFVADRRHLWDPHPDIDTRPDIDVLGAQG